MGQKQFAKLLSFLWLALSQGQRFTTTVGRENNLHSVSNFLSDPKEEELKRINPVTITETEIRNVLTLLFWGASLLNILFRPQLRYHARVA